MNLPTLDKLWFDPAGEAEARCLRQALGWLSIPEKFRAIRAAAQRDYPRFANFNEVVPNLPVQIIPWTPSATEERGGGQFMPLQALQLIRSFDASAVGKAYRALQSAPEREQDRRPLGMLMLHAGVAGGLLVHDAHQFTSRYGWTCRTRTGEVHLEAFRNVLQAIVRSGWTADQPLARKDVTPPVLLLDPGRVVPAAIVARCGRGAKACILDLVLQLATCRLPEGRNSWLRVDDEGGRWVVLRQLELGELTHQRRPGGYGLRAIQEALQQLVTDGLLGTKRGFSGRGNPQGYQPTTAALDLMQEPKDLEVNNET